MISIIVPVYNVDKYIERCIKSILNQRNACFELILVDDGSTDSSGIICDKYTSDRRVHVLHQKNQGVSVARNVGINISKGDYLLFVDSDDWLADNALSELMNNCYNFDLIMFGAYSAKMNDDGKYIYSKRIYWPNRNASFVVSDKYKDIFNINVTLWNKLIRRSVIADIRFNESMTYGEDCDFLCRVLANVETAVILPKELYYYFINRQGSVVASQINNKSIELLENTKFIYDYLITIGQGSVGVRRIYIVVNEILSKVPLTKIDIKKNHYYIKKARKLLCYPRLIDIIRFLFDKNIDKNCRIMYCRILFNPFHMYYCLLRNRKTHDSKMNKEVRK